MEIVDLMSIAGSKGNRIRIKGMFSERNSNG